MSSEINAGNISNIQNLAIKMGENYKNVINYFPENTKSGYDTEALPSIWENKNTFNEFNEEASNDAFKFSEILTGLTNSGDKRHAEKVNLG